MGVGGFVERTVHLPSWADKKIQQEHSEVTEMSGTQARGTTDPHFMLND